MCYILFFCSILKPFSSSNPDGLRWMRPGVSHCVHTLGDTIAVGGHFHAFATMDCALQSAFEEAMYGQTITNTQHLETDALLFRLVEYMKRDLAFVSDEGRSMMLDLLSLFDSDAFRSVGRGAAYPVAWRVATRARSAPGV